MRHDFISNVSIAGKEIKLFLNISNRDISDGYLKKYVLINFTFNNVSCLISCNNNIFSSTKIIIITKNFWEIENQLKIMSDV